MKQITLDRQFRMPDATMRRLPGYRDQRPHCTLVLVVNAGLVACAAAEPFTWALGLHLVLLPFNAWRLLRALRTDGSARSPTQRLAAKREPSNLVTTRPTGRLMLGTTFPEMAMARTVRLPARRAVCQS